jgi:hypothetical protein
MLDKLKENHFSFFRILFGAYLCIHLAMLIPYASEIWSSDGILPEASFNLTNGVFPNILNYFDSPLQVTLFVCILTICSIFITIGYKRALFAFILWYGWVCLFDRNNLISNPGIPFVGWLLLCCSLIPSGEGLSVSKVKKDWKLPKILFIGAWVIMAVSYTLSGIDKFNSPSWFDGTAILHLLNNPLARDWFIRDFLLLLPKELIYLMTWSILALEILFLPFSIWSKTRKYAWLLMVIMHFGILLIVDFADLTFGMLMIHAFTLDVNWIQSKKTEN